MQITQNTFSIVDGYFADPDTQKILSSVEEIRAEAQNAKRGFYKKYWWALVLTYILVGYITFSVRMDDWDIRLLGGMWIGPGLFFYNKGTSKQSLILALGSVSTKLFNHFISKIFPGSKFDELDSLYGEDVSKSSLFMDKYDEKYSSNSIFLPFIKNINGETSVEIRGVEAHLSRTEGSGKNKRIIIDLGMLYRVIIINPKRTIKSSVTITPNNDSWFASKRNNVPLEDKEFEEHFDVQSEDPIEARMILTSNVMYELTQFIKQSSAEYTFRFINNNFYIKRKLDTSFMNVDWDKGIDQNKQTYIEFYNELAQIEKLVNALNVDYYQSSSIPQSISSIPQSISSIPQSISSIPQSISSIHSKIPILFIVSGFFFGIIYALSFVFPSLNNFFKFSNEEFDSNLSSPIQNIDGNSEHNTGLSYDSAGGLSLEANRREVNRSNTMIYGKVKIYEGSIRDPLTKDMNEGILEYDGRNYTLVRKEGIVNSFENMGVEIKDFDSYTGATIYLKQLFTPYADKYPDIFAANSWYDGVEQSRMYMMLDEWLRENNIPYIGSQYSNGDYFGSGNFIHIWFPIRILGNFSAMGVSKDVGGFFENGNISSARLSIDPTISSNSGKGAVNLNTKFTLYQGATNVLLTEDMNEGLQDYNGKQYTYVRNDGIMKAYENMGVQIRNLNDWNKITILLKVMFYDYKDEFPGLFLDDVNNRASILGNGTSDQKKQLFSLINKWAIDNNIPRNTSNYFDVRLPIRDTTTSYYRFVHLSTTSSHYEGSVARFDWGFHGDTRMAVGFKSKLNKSSN